MQVPALSPRPAKDARFCARSLVADSYLLTKPSFMFARESAQTTLAADSWCTRMSLPSLETRHVHNSLDDERSPTVETVGTVLETVAKRKIDRRDWQSIFVTAMFTT